jgi:hypothetical protein
MTIRSNSVQNAVPESPPPPYVTPPGTTARQFDYSFTLNLPGPSTYSVYFIPVNINNRNCKRLYTKSMSINNAWHNFFQHL